MNWVVALAILVASDFFSLQVIHPSCHDVDASWPNGHYGPYRTDPGNRS